LLTLVSGRAIVHFTAALRIASSIGLGLTFGFWRLT